MIPDNLGKYPLRRTMVVEACVRCGKRTCMAIYLTEPGVTHRRVTICRVCHGREARDNA